MLSLGPMPCDTIKLQSGYTAHEYIEMMCFLKIPAENDSQSRPKYSLIFLFAAVFKWSNSDLFWSYSSPTD